MKIVCIVALYHPDPKELYEISRYIDDTDQMFLMDDSETSNQHLISECLGDFAGKCSYIWNERNIGLCASVNRGITYALENGADWILLMDQDSAFQTNILSAFRNHIKIHETEAICALAPQYNYDRHKRQPYRGTKLLKWANMSGTLLNAGLLKSIGKFDERLFIDGLDVEWCTRARSKGYQIIEVGEAILYHHPAFTKEFSVKNKVLFRYGWDKPSRYYYQFRSYWYIIKKYHDVESIKWFLVKLCKVLLLFEHKREYIRMFIKGVRDANRGNWGKI